MESTTALAAIPVGRGNRLRLGKAARVTLFVTGVAAWIVLGATLAVVLSVFGPRLSMPIVDGRDGSSVEGAVWLDAADETVGVPLEYLWMSAYYPLDTVTAQSLMPEGDQVYDVLELTSPGGETHQVWFNINDWYGVW